MDSDSYIFVHLMGGLGNQLFQYAAGLLQKKVTNGTLLLEKATDNKHDENDYRKELFNLGIPYDAMIPNHVSLYQDNGFKPWNPHEYKFPTLYMHGYFQNYTCLEPILPEFKSNILEQLQSRKKIIKEKYIIPPNSAFIHVRRGDYFSIGFDMKDESYYTKAINIIKQHKNIEYWYILSDDLNYVKKDPILQSLNPIYVDEKDPLDCLAFMSEIHTAAIIANSTFSWMGAYLGIGPVENSVVYPKNWINQGTPDLFPNVWVSI